VVDKADGAVFRGTLSDSRSDRGLEVPAWMFDRSCCPDRTNLTEAPFVSAGALEALSAVLDMASKTSLYRRIPCFLAHPTSLATRTGESAMPQKTVMRRSVRRQGLQLTHRQRELFEANPRDSVVSAPAWPELPVEARAACSRAWMDNGGSQCIAFGGLRVDDAIEEALLRVVGPGAIAAAANPAEQASQRRDQVREVLGRDLEAARYAADRAFRQYDAADPTNRLVTGELEIRWNKTLAHVAEIEAKIATHDAAQPSTTIDPVALCSLASNLRTVWSAPTTDARLKKRIVRTLIQEVVADIDDATAEIVLTVHWIGGAHSEMRLPKRRRGQRNSTSADIVLAVRQLVLIAKDDLIAGILNRNGLQTGNGHRWTRERVTSMRSNYRIPVFKAAENGIEPWLNLGNAAKILKIAPKTLRIAAEAGKIEAIHPLPDGPWIFARAALATSPAQSLAERARQNPKYPTGSQLDQQSLFSSIT
jgi:hypothetical protein